MLSACSATLPQMQCSPEPPPASLTAPVDAGPEYPDADVPLRELLGIVAARESAAAVCRARHRGLADWAHGVTK